MATTTKTRIGDILQKYEKELLADWMRELKSTSSRQHHLANESELEDHCSDFLRVMSRASDGASTGDIAAPAWAPVRDLL
jgi:hypothetical protein